MKIIDVSVHQGKIDWKKVRAVGIGGVIIRAGYGRGNIDGRFKENIEGAIKAGFKTIGVYWFSYAYDTEMAKREAQFCNDVIKPYKDKINLGVYFDWEYDSMNYAKKNGVYPNKNLITNMNLYFCERIKELGYKAGYYLNLDYQKNFIDTSRLKAFYKWFARYTSETQKDCYLWQYSSTGKVSGISGNVDMNELIGKPVEHNNGNKNNAGNTEDYNMPTIKRGKSGKAVKIWQVIIGTTVDGIFGTNTEAKTKAFQEKHKLKVDGIVGPKTWKAGLESVK
jgi:GH25 family lysozyme M1 (1,4-beta-N-acetylmuramidase)